MTAIIRPNHNQRSASLPVDDEAEGVICTLYVKDGANWVPANAASQFTTDQVRLKNAAGTAVIEPATNGTLQQLRDKDFATQATLASVLAQLDDATADTVLSVLKSLNAKDLATEARLLEVRNLLDVLVQQTNTLESDLLALLNSVYRRTDSLPAGANNIGYITPSSSQKVVQGRFNIAGTGRLNLTVAGNIRITISNPVGSGKTVSILRIACLATATGWASLILNPTTGLPVSATRPILNAIAGGGIPPVAQVKVDTDVTTPLGGGTDTGVVLGIPTTERVEINTPPLVLGQGVTLGINVPFGGASEMSGSVYWVED